MIDSLLSGKFSPSYMFPIFVVGSVCYFTLQSVVLKGKI